MDHHRKHRNIIYSLVVLLAIIQIVSFAVITIQIARINVKLNDELQRTNIELKEYSNTLVNSYDTAYQENFKEISRAFTDQKEIFDKEIQFLKSTTQEDFSGVVNIAVKSVVTISTENSIGTGFIVNEEGYVVTNYHVIADKEKSIFVTAYDRNSVPAELIGKDEIRDLALLKISKTDRVQYLELTDSDNLQVGRKVIAIGNPLGLSFTVTEGIISGLDRTGPNGISEYVQTDVSLNPGNSGGPLIDMQGKVVGINNFKIGGAESLGFSLESNSIKKSINNLAGKNIII